MEGEFTNSILKSRASRDSSRQADSRRTTFLLAIVASTARWKHNTSQPAQVHIGVPRPGPWEEGGPTCALGSVRRFEYSDRRAEAREYRLPFSSRKNPNVNSSGQLDAARLNWKV